MLYKMLLFELYCMVPLTVIYKMYKTDFLRGQFVSAIYI